MLVFMGPVSLVVCRQQMLGLIYYFIGWVERETEAGPMDCSAGLRVGVGSTFPREQ
jgi:hypothetical protein